MSKRMPKLHPKPNKIANKFAYKNECNIELPCNNETEKLKDECIKQGKSNYSNCSTNNTQIFSDQNVQHINRYNNFLTKHYNSENNSSSKLSKNGFPDYINQITKKSKSKEVSYKIPERSLHAMGYNSENQSKFNHIRQYQKSKLYDKLQEVIEKNLRPNILIKIGEYHKRCHLMVLQCYANVFKENTSDVVFVLPENKLSGEIFEFLYKWMVYDNVAISRENLLKVYMGGKFLEMPELETQCWQLLSNNELFVEDEAFLLYLEAKDLDITNIKELMLSRIYKFFLTAVSTKDFLMMEIKSIKSLLQTNTIGVHSEMEVFFTAIRWLNYDWKERKKNVLEIMNCIRFSLMPCWFLISLQKVKEGLEVLRVMNFPEVKKSIDDGLS